MASTTSAEIVTTNDKKKNNNSLLELDSSSNCPEIVSLNELEISFAPDVEEYLATQYDVLDETRSGQSNSARRHWDKIRKSMKTAPMETCCRVNLLLSSVEEVERGLSEYLSFMVYDINRRTRRRRGFVVRRHEAWNDLVLIRCQRTQDEQEEQEEQEDLASCRVPKLTGDDDSGDEKSKSPFPHWKKREEKGWPMSHRAVVVDRLCGEAVLRGSDVFVKGILCADAGIAVGETLAVYADLKPHNSSKPVPRGLLLENYSGKCVFLGMGTSSCHRSQFFAQSTGLGISMTHTAGPTQPPLNGVLTGKIMLQNLPSALVAQALDPHEGDVILDMCCAPGGKTSHVASLIHNRGFIVACDKSRKKMIRARQFFHSMGATCITPLAIDSTKLLLQNPDDTTTTTTTTTTTSIQHYISPQSIIASASSSKKDGLLNVTGFYAESFDRILLDPPCSALGLRPKLLVDLSSLSDLMKYAEYQRNFLRNAIPLLKVGGIMTYSTCTINALENEKMVKYVLTEYPNMKLVPIMDINLDGLEGLPGMGLTDEERKMVRRFDPCDERDTMGFFIAKFVKYSSSTI